MSTPILTFQENLVEIGIRAERKEEAIKRLSDRLLAGGYVKESFYENVLRREAEFPTGLPTAIPLALCHTESEHVNETAIAVGTLETPVRFQEMGTPENDVMAEIIFVIALKDPKGQVFLLQRMMEVFKNEQTLSTIRNATDIVSLVEFLNQVFA
jgi:PTS system galactitol-specific IIA component